MIQEIRIRKYESWLRTGLKELNLTSFYVVFNYTFVGMDDYNDVMTIADGIFYEIFSDFYESSRDVAIESGYI